MIGNNIRKIRKSKKMSINSLAKKAGVSLGYLSDLENDKFTNPTLDKLNSIADALNVSVGDFFANDLSDNIEINVPKEYTDKYKVTSRDKKQYLAEMKKANEAFFMDDELNENAKKEMLDLMSELFWKAKAMNKRKK